MNATNKEMLGLDWLYQEIILDHYKRPRNFGVIENSDAVVEEENPYCGDHIIVSVKTDGEKVADIRFSGKGCAISQASASMMTEKVKGMKLEEALKFAEDFRKMMRGEKPFPPEGELEDLDALRGVREFPIRIKCATLAWDLLHRSLAQILSTKGWRRFDVKCEDLLKALSDYIDGEIDPSICEEFERHLKDCEPCKIVVDTVHKTILLYKGTEVYEIPSELKERIHSLLKEKWKEKFPEADC